MINVIRNVEAITLVTYDLSLILSIIATTIAVLSFGGTAWRIWRDRPRLAFYVSSVIFHNKSDDKKFHMIKVLACNIGYRPILLKKFAAVGEKSCFHMGIHDEPAAMYGHQDQKFPVLLKPGESLDIHPMPIEALKRNQTDPKDPKKSYHPYKYFVFINSFGGVHSMDVDDVMGHLHLGNRMSKSTTISKFNNYLKRKLFFIRVKRRNIFD